MSVEHSVNIGEGVDITYFLNTLLEESDEDPEEFLSRTLAAYPDLDYAVGGSYWGSDDFSYVVLIKATTLGSNDLIGVKTLAETTMSPRLLDSLYDFLYEIGGKELRNRSVVKTYAVGFEY